MVTCRAFELLRDLHVHFGDERDRTEKKIVLRSDTFFCLPDDIRDKSVLKYFSWIMIPSRAHSLMVIHCMKLFLENLRARR